MGWSYTQRQNTNIYDKISDEEISRNNSQTILPQKRRQDKSCEAREAHATEHMEHF